MHLKGAAGELSVWRTFQPATSMVDPCAWPLDPGGTVGQARGVRQRLSMVTLGVADVDRSRAFYEALGWRGTGGSDGGPVFFQAGDMIVALWERAALARDSEVVDGGGWGGITLAHNVATRAEVDDITEAARAAGATVARAPAETFWGGYDSVVLDPDGHPWEIAHNPGWRVDDDGGVHLT